MATTTTIYSFSKPSVGGDVDSWGGLLNTNWDNVDTYLSELFAQNPGATRPTRVRTHGIWLDTDTNIYYRYNGTDDIALFGEVGSAVQYYLDNDANSYIKKDNNEFEVVIDGAIAAEIGTPRATFRTSELYVQSASGGDGPSVTLYDVAQADANRGQLRIDYDFGSLQFNSYSNTGVFQNILYRLSVDSSGLPSSHDFYIGTNRQFAIGPVASVLDSNLVLDANNAYFEMRNPLATSTFRNTRITRNTSTFQIGTYDSFFSEVDQFYQVTLGASGATSQGWNITNSEAMSLDTNKLRLTRTANPTLELYASGGIADQRNFSIEATTTSFSMGPVNDANSSGQGMLVGTLSAGSVTQIDLRTNDIDRITITNDTTSILNDITVQSTSPRIRLNETDAPTDEKTWDLLASGGAFSLQTRNDALDDVENVWVVNKSGADTTRQRLYVANSAMLDMDSTGVEIAGELRLPSRFFEVTSFTLANDSVQDLDIGRNVFGGMLFLATNNASLGAEIFHFRASTPPGISQLTSNANFDSVAGTNLTGTTGGAGVTRVSSQTGGLLQVQNREGTSVVYCALVLYI